MESADIFLWGVRIGSVSRKNGAPCVDFEYSPELYGSGIEPSPLRMPVMDRNGEWTLSPAYDECYAYNPNGAWTSGHQMSINGKKTDVTDADMVQAGRIAGLPAKECKGIISEVRDAVRTWPRFAAEAGVKDEFVSKIGARLMQEEMR